MKMQKKSEGGEGPVGGWGGCDPSIEVFVKMPKKSGCGGGGWRRVGVGDGSLVPVAQW